GDKGLCPGVVIGIATAIHARRKAWELRLTGQTASSIFCPHPSLPGAVMDFDQIPGWFDFASLYDEMVARSRPGAIFVEVGASLGRSTAYLASRLRQARKPIQLFVVDLWDGWFYDNFQRQTPMPQAGDVYWHFLRNMQRCGVCHLLCPVKLASERAAAL